MTNLKRLENEFDVLNSEMLEILNGDDKYRRSPEVVVLMGKLNGISDEIGIEVFGE